MVEGFIGNTPADFIKPIPSGDIPCSDGEFDLVVCLSVLHHKAYSSGSGGTKCGDGCGVTV